MNTVQINQTKNLHSARVEVSDYVYIFLAHIKSFSYQVEIKEEKRLSDRMFHDNNIIISLYKIKFLLYLLYLI